MIYLDNASTTLVKPKEVAEAVFEAIAGQTIGNPTRAGHAASLRGLHAVTAVREAVKAYFSADDEEMETVFTKNATEAANILLKGFLRPGDHIITTEMEHNAILRPLYHLQQQGVELTILPLDSETGRASVEQFRAAIRPGVTRAIVTSHASNVTGCRNDLQTLGALCTAYELAFFVDVAQTAGIEPIDMGQMKMDALIFTGHKSLYGPQGSGGLVLRESLASQIEPLLDGGTGVFSQAETMPSQLPEHLEAGTLSTPSIIGLGAGLAYLETHPQAGKRAKQAAGKFYQALADEPGVHFYGYDKAAAPSLVSLNIGSLDSNEVACQLMAEYGIACRGGLHCAPLIHRHYGTEQQGMVRFSFSSFTTPEEIEQAVGAVRQLAQKRTKEEAE
ncbi:aminotransferase class V-fold PLP-dependent enzyme [Listeria costaricensis]|uniref:aminotransferase class V-fold PLP-dependent enzyme n=1 Tax=Listeria costaricensis TaxID=2026604 RepID=UPI000C072315|nr:aminotransferase class V-fold PLP-dependent enzyme [Listeria costaricensis]